MRNHLHMLGEQHTLLHAVKVKHGVLFMQGRPVVGALQKMCGGLGQRAQCALWWCSDSDCHQHNCYCATACDYK